MDTLIESIKKHEGFDGFEYLDTKGNKTIGYGTLLPLTQEEAELLLNLRLNKMMDELKRARPIVNELNSTRQHILYEMAYQMGVPHLLGFKKMFIALDKGDIVEAANEMIDSHWYRKYIARASKMVDIFRRGY